MEWCSWSFGLEEIPPFLGKATRVCSWRVSGIDCRGEFVLCKALSIIDINIYICTYLYCIICGCVYAGGPFSSFRWGREGHRAWLGLARLGSALLRAYLLRAQGWKGGAQEVYDRWMDAVLLHSE